MASFGDLPNEIVALVCHALLDDQVYLHHDKEWSLAALEKTVRSAGARKALSNFSRTNHMYRQIAEPLLYRRCGQTLTQFRAAMCLLRTFIERPNLATFVLELDISNAVKSDQRSASSFDLAPFRAVINSFGIEVPGAISFEDKFIDKLCATDLRERIEAASALGLALLPKLTKAKVCGLLENPYPISDYLFSALDALPGCKSLEVLEINVSDGEHRLWLHSHLNASLLLVPSLRRVVLSGINGNMVVGLTPETLKFPELALIRPGAREKAINELLGACEQLTSFECVDWDWTGRGKTVDSAALKNALRGHQLSLKKLSIFSSPYGNVARYRREYYPTGSLRYFTALEDLQIEENCLLGLNEEAIPVTRFSLFEMLPPSIRNLRILYASTRLLPAIEYAASQGFEHLPNFERLQIDPSPECQRKSKKFCFDGLSTFFAFSKVEYRVWIAPKKTNSGDLSVSRDALASDQRQWRR